MKVVLTGDRGYIGAVLAPMLLDRGHDVVGIDSDLFEACTFAGDLAEYRKIRKDSTAPTPSFISPGFRTIRSAIIGPS
jgi:nucleoside-diphosphate-sugar epimerase